MTEQSMRAVRLTPWLWCLRTPIVQAYAVRDRQGFNLVDAGIAGSEEAILRCLATIDQTDPGAVALHEIVLTHGHDDHSGAAAALSERTGARVLASAIDAPVIEGRQAPAEPQLTAWEVPLYERVRPSVPPAPPAHVDQHLDQGARLDWGELATVVASPGHTAGSISLLFPGAPADRSGRPGGGLNWRERPVGSDRATATVLQPVPGAANHDRAHAIHRL